MLLCTADLRADPNVIVVPRSRIEQMGARTLLDILQLIPVISVAFGYAGEPKVTLLGVSGDTRIAQLIDGKPINQSYAGRAFWRMPADVIERIEITLGGWQPWLGPGGLQGAVNILSRTRQGIDAEERLGGLGATNATLSLGKEAHFGEGYLSTSVWDEPLALKELQPLGLFSPSSFSHRPRVTGNRLLFGVVGNGAVHTPQREVNVRADGYALLEQTALGIYWQRFMVSGGNLGVDIPIGGRHLLQFDGVVNGNAAFTQEPLSLDEQNPLVQQVRYKAMEIALESQGWFELVKGNMLHVDLIGAVEGLLPNSYHFALNHDKYGHSQDFTDALGVSLGQNGNCFLLGRSQKGFGACRVWSMLSVMDDWSLDNYVRLGGGAQLLLAGLATGNQVITVLPDLRLDITPDEDWRVGLLYADTARLPAFMELFDQSGRFLVELLPGRFLGNAQLSAEKARNLALTLGYSHQFGPVKLIAEGRGFFTRIRQVVEPVEDKGDINILHNDGGYDVVGIGGLALMEFGQGNQVFWNAQWLRAYWRTLDASGWPKCRAFFFDAVGNAPRCTMMTSMPQLQMNLGGNFSVANAGVIYVLANFVSERRNNARTDMERNRAFRLPSYGVLNASYVSPVWLRFWRLEFTVFNILNTKIQDDITFADSTAGLLAREGFAAYAAISFLLS